MGIGQSAKNIIRQLCVECVFSCKRDTNNVAVRNSGAFTVHCDLPGK